MAIIQTWAKCSSPIYREREEWAGTPQAARMEALTGKLVEKVEELRDRGEYEVQGEIEHFIECMLENKQPKPSSGDERKALEIVLAAYRSADTGKVVKLPI